MKRLSLIIAALAAVALLSFSCSKSGSPSSRTTYAIESYFFDNGIESDQAALRSELETFLGNCDGKESSEVKSGAQSIVDKYAEKTRTYIYKITIGIYKDSKSSGFLLLTESLV